MAEEKSKDTGFATPKGEVKAETIPAPRKIKVKAIEGNFAVADDGTKAKLPVNVTIEVGAEVQIRHAHGRYVVVPGK